MVLEHLGAGLGGEHVDGPASQVVGSVVDVELEASADVGLNVETLSLLVVHGDGGPVNAAAHLLEQVGGEELKVVGGAGGVAGDLDNLVIILDNVKLNLELADESVLVDPVSTDLHASVSMGKAGDRLKQ